MSDADEIPESSEAPRSSKGPIVGAVVIVLLLAVGWGVVRVFGYSIRVGLANLDTERVVEPVWNQRPNQQVVDDAAAVLRARFESAGVPARVEVKGQNAIHVFLQKDDEGWLRPLLKTGRLRLNILVTNQVSGTAQAAEIQRLLKEKEVGIYRQSDRYDVARWSQDALGEAPAYALLYNTTPSGKPEYVDGVWVTSAYADVDDQGEPAIGFDLDRTGSKHLYELTQKNIGQPLGFSVDGELHSAPEIRTPLGGGSLMLGDWTEQEAKELSAALDGGPLPVGLRVREGN